MTCSLDLCSSDDGYQIRLSRGEGDFWYVGALFWILDICGATFAPETNPGGDLQIAAFEVTSAEFDGLRKDAVVYAYYGQPSNPSMRTVACGTLNARLSLPQPIGACMD